MSAERKPVDVNALRGYARGKLTVCNRGDYGDYDGNCIVVLGEDRRVAVFLGSDTADKANARLFAAAPNLLAEVIARRAKDEAVVELITALERALRWVEMSPPGEPLRRECEEDIEFATTILAAVREGA